MLVSLREIMRYAEEKEIAIGAFNVPNWESAKAIIKSAEKENSPVIMNYAPLHAPFLSIEDAAFIMTHFASNAKVPVCVHLDHGSSFEICMKAIRLGFTSVMIDASALSYEDNIKTTKEVVKAAHSVNVSVEAELGHIFSSEIGIKEVETTIENSDSFKNLDDVYTNPSVAKDFVEQTNVDALAIAFGTSHGIYITKPKLDLDRIKEIKKAINIPFVMHGGSGLSKEEFQEAIHNGIRKINYYTYMSLDGGAAIKDYISQKPENVFFHDLPNVAIEAMENNLVKAIRIFALKE